ncbi:hypothetical protein BGY98DRAFT_1093641 [Russula aff. rugulosa BPL654]|nr:hypothetical protein BGY98DRAFT_1093641 [Russula aff. rugulosa BPL654]
MPTRQRTTGHRVKEASKPTNVARVRSKHSKPRWTSWIRTTFIVSCTAALLIYLYRKLALTSTPHPPFIPESYDDGDLGPAYTVRDLPGRGKGMIAVRDIRRGELLIRERPLMVVPYSINTSPSQFIWELVQQLTPDQVASFHNLSHVNLPENLSPDSEEFLKELQLAIFETNAVAAGSNVGLFPRMARLNHGCSGAFNSVYSWREREGALVVHALKDIREGDELLTVYFGTRQTRDKRRHYLMQNYGFHCMCTYCTLSDEKSKASDVRLTTMDDLYNRLGTWGHGAIDGQEAIRLVKRIWSIGEEEGYTSERGRLAADAMVVAVAHADAEAAVDWARLALQWASYELGSDSDLAEEMRIVMREPRGHRMWGQRWGMGVEKPSAGMSDVT